jgi:predicted phosphodiesterase
MAKRTIIHLSDLHIGLRPKESRRTRMVINYVAENFPGVPLLFTGDLTDSASKSQFRGTRELLDELALTNPILTVPGNHDYAWKGNILRPDGWENWVRYLGSPLGWGRPEVPWMGEDHEPVGVDGLGVWKDGPLVYFGIDSGDPEDKQISARGYISQKLATGLRESLENYKGKTRIAFLHHHPFTEGFFIKLHGSRRLLNAVKDNCELLLFGHEHAYGIWWASRGVPLIVSSHKSTDAVSGDSLMVTIIEIENAGRPNVSFRHRLEVLQKG